MSIIIVHLKIAEGCQLQRSALSRLPGKAAVVSTQSSDLQLYGRLDGDKRTDSGRLPVTLGLVREPTHVQGNLDEYPARDF